MPVSKLYMIATPLGNREDITLRALERLKALTVFFAEDTRELSKLLELYGISRDGKRMHSYASHNMKDATKKALVALAEGNDIGFVSDRGTPGISDPGALLASEAHQAGYDVVPIPGASSVAAALSVCGFSADRYLFLGFLPSSNKERDELWRLVREASLTASFFESPKRVRETLEEMKARFPNGRVFLGREMTKMFETYTFFPLASLVPETVMEKGEYVIILDPGSKPIVASAWEEEVRARLLPDKGWAKVMAARHQLPASELYNALQRERRELELLKEKANSADK